MKTSKFGILAFIACQAVFLSGCTSALWERERFAHCHWSANPSNLRLYYSAPAQDVLVEYDETSENSTAIKRRAYWAERNADKVAAGVQPRFVSGSAAQDLPVVPVIDASASSPTSSYQGLYAVVATDGLSFTLYPGDKEPVIYKLPAYFAGPGQRAKQVLLTPFAVAVDATLVGAVVAVVAIAAEAESGGADFMQAGRVSAR
jgi:hypothetical protein